MSELQGLKNLLASSGPLHGIAASPARDVFATDADYQAAYDAWWLRTLRWNATWRDIRVDD
jgi:hypothetical protein